MADRWSGPNALCSLDISCSHCGGKSGFPGMFGGSTSATNYKRLPPSVNTHQLPISGLQSVYYIGTLQSAIPAPSTALGICSILITICTGVHTRKSRVRRPFLRKAARFQAQPMQQDGPASKHLEGVRQKARRARAVLGVRMGWWLRWCHEQKTRIPAI